MAENRECVSTPSNHARRSPRYDSRGQKISADDSADGIVTNNTSEASSSLSSNSCSYLEIHPYSLVSDAMVASWPPYAYTSAPEDSIGDEAEKYQAPTEWSPPTEAQYLRYSAWPSLTGLSPRFPRAYTLLDGLFFDEFLKHVPIIHPVLGRKQITEDHQLATIACALGSLAAEDVPPGYVCATWMETYKRVAAKVVRQLHVMCPCFADGFTEGRGNRMHNRFPFGILLPSRRPNIPVASERYGRNNEGGDRGVLHFLCNPCIGLHRLDSADDPAGFCNIEALDVPTRPTCQYPTMRCGRHGTSGSVTK
jgi:hypothetical protein